MSGIVERALIDREFDTEKNRRLLAVYIQPSKRFFGQSSAKRQTRVQLASLFPLMPRASRLCLILHACVLLFALVSGAFPLCLAFRACVSRSPLVFRVSLSHLALPPYVSRFALVFRASPLCLAFRACRLALPPCVSRFALVSHASRLFLAFRACLAFRLCVSRLAIAFLARLTELLLCRL